MDAQNDDSSTVKDTLATAVTPNVDQDDHTFSMYHCSNPSVYTIDTIYLDYLYYMYHNFL